MSKEKSKRPAPGQGKGSTRKRASQIHNVRDGKIEKRAAELTPRPNPPKGGKKK